MGIPLRNSRKNRRRRRSYADYKPTPRRQGPRNDPFRMLFYLILIAGGLWVYTNQEQSLAAINGALDRPESAETVSEAEEEAAGSEGGDAEAELTTEQIAANAEALYREGKLTEAIELYTQAAAAAPNTVDYYVQIARMHLFTSALQYGEASQQSLEAASDAANSAILADPFDPGGYAILGKVRDWQGRPEEALNNIVRALEINDTYAVAQSYYAEALIDLDRWDQATETIEFALELDPNNVDIRRDYAYILESFGDYAGAATQYEAALTLHPNLAYLKIALARDYRVLGRYNESLDAFFDLQILDPNNPLLAYEIGRTYETYLGDPNSAMEQFEQAVEADPDYALPWLRIGNIRYLQGGYSQAAIAFERALALGIESADLYAQLGLAYAFEGRCDTASSNFLQAQQLAEGDERILDLVQDGYDTCAQPTPNPEDVLGTPTIEAEASN